MVVTVGGGGPTSIWRLETQDAAKHPIMYKTAPFSPTKNNIVPNVNNADFETLS